MKQTREAMAQKLAERLCWQAARRDDSRVARRVSRKQLVDGVSQLDEGAWLDDGFSFLHAVGVVDWLGAIQGTAVPRERVPCSPDLLRYSLKTLLGIERMHALPALLFSDEARRRLVGFKAPQVRHGVCPRGAAQRQGPRTRGPMCPEALADTIVKRNVRDLAAWFNGGIRALATAGVFAPKVTGIVDATALETTAPYEGCGQGTRTRKLTDTRGYGHELAVTVDGWQLLVLIDAVPTIPGAGQVVPSHAHAVLSTRALVTQASTNLAGPARLHTVVCAKGFGDGVDLGWLEPRGITCVVPANDHRAVTAEARAQATAGEGITVGRRGHTVRQGPGRAARTARLETEVGGIPGLTTDDP